MWSGVNHLALVTPDMDATVRFYAGVLGMPLVTRQRITAAGSEVTEIVDHDVFQSIYFTDPNGIALEASYWVVDGTCREADFDDESRFSDPDPVPAIAELRAGGLTSPPRTSLV